MIVLINNRFLAESIKAKNNRLKKNVCKVLELSCNFLKYAVGYIDPSGHFFFHEIFWLTLDHLDDVSRFSWWLEKK